MHPPNSRGSGSITVLIGFVSLWLSRNGTNFQLVPTFRFLLFLWILSLHDRGNCCCLPQEMSRQHLGFFPLLSFLSPFLLRGIGPGNYLMSRLVHLRASWFVSIFSLRSGRKRHLFSWGERHSVSITALFPECNGRAFAPQWSSPLPDRLLWEITRFVSHYRITPLL